MTTILKMRLVAYFRVLLSDLRDNWLPQKYNTYITLLTFSIGRFTQIEWRFQSEKRLRHRGTPP